MPMMTTSPPPPPSSPVRLADYQPPAFRIVETRLTLDLDFSETTVNAHHRVRRYRPAQTELAQTDPAQTDLILDLDALRIDKIGVDGKTLEAGQYRIETGKLVLFDVPDEFDLTIENSIRPDRNSALSGLYQSGDMLCTQCEAEGFRRITPAIDRPDNLGRYSVTLRADKKTMPLLLCNGNLIAQGDNADGTHYATWHDPFPKPTYLFAIVAGKLACLEEHFTTAGNRDVTLRFFARPQDIDRCAHAMAALKRAMAWDEKIYGREYDLDLFNVVAVGDFNMGAMENKSLNIFNTKYVLADLAIATDTDFRNVENVIGHEYFHNWSGNRVTCRDWFQLSLKEGFTVFREQQFSADMGSKAVKRIEDVDILRNHQFREDAGPMAHPVRPDSYIEINNFYTATVYHKGAEVIRMLHTLLGGEKFRHGTDLYFTRHDGQAVTTDDFVAAMESVSGMDLTQFKNWYSQAGTPVVEVKTDYDAERGVLEITLSQSCRPTPGQPDKAPFVIPVRAALFDLEGKRMATNTPADSGKRDDLLVLSQPRQSFTFTGIKSRPVASLLRGFSAPVELRQRLSARELALLLSSDDDPFNRWEAGQKLFFGHILDRVKRIQSGGVGGPTAKDAAAKDRADKDGVTIDTVTAAFESVLDETDSDPALQAKILTLPSEAYLSEHLQPIDPAAIFHARLGLRRHLANALRPKLLQRYHQLEQNNDGTINAAQIGNRSLRDTCLGYLVSLDDPEIHALSSALLANSRCMTDSAAALSALANSGKPDRQTLLDDFYQKWKDEPLVVNKWLAIQSTVAADETLSRVEYLTHHEAFDHTNPNKVYSLLLGFSHVNPFCFHARDGSGYHFVGHWVAQLDPLNPQVAARLVSAFTNWKKYIPELKDAMRARLEEIARLPKLSPDVAEIVGKSLEN